MSKLSVLVEERIRRAVERARKQAKVERARKATPDEKACSFDGCGRVAHSRGLCHAHYMQQYRSGKLTPVMERAEGPLVRLLLDEIMLVEVHRACVRIVREREKQAARLRESMERDLREDEP